MRRLWLMAGMAAVAGAAGCLFGCSFDGSAGRTLDPESDAAPDSSVSVDGGPSAPPVTCEGFKQIGTSYYKLFPELFTWEQALARCAALPGAHLATFETIEEPAAVVVGLPVNAPTWTGVEQRVNLGSSGVGEDWYNRVGTIRLPIPLAFPWRPGEPNDLGPPENDQEDFGELYAPGVFDDAPGNRPSRALCECVISP